ncbi:hypothetical protein GCM10025860_12610 [Methanobacterium ferruginis]|nr:hypothetical protein GCM10025860_12610 [Methanobacterium ferruginis]
MNIMLNPKITRLAITHITADKNPVAVPINIAAKAHLFSNKKFTINLNIGYIRLIVESARTSILFKF